MKCEKCGCELDKHGREIHDGWTGRHRGQECIANLKAQLSAAQAEVERMDRTCRKAHHDDKAAMLAMAERAEKAEERLNSASAIFDELSSGYLARAENAETIVAKLPKTVDGVVLTVGSEYWMLRQGQWCRETVQRTWLDNYSQAQCYSTREAAMAAFNKTVKK